MSKVRQALAAELRALRTLAGLSQRHLRDAAASLSQPHISRAERGEALLSRVQVLEWLDATGAVPEVRDRVLALTEASHHETRAWGDLYSGGATHLQGAVQQWENSAGMIRNFQPTVVPGLLQTAEYARLLLPLTDVAQRQDHAEALAGRLKRQELLYREGRQFEFLIAESVLRWAPGPAAMPAQLDRLVTLSTLATVEIAVLPTATTAGVPWHNFVIFSGDPDGSPDYVVAELVHGVTTISDVETVTLYAQVWSQLWEAAATGDDAVALIRRASQQGG